MILLTILTTLAAAFFAYEIYLHFIKPHLSAKELVMITQTEQSIVDFTRGLKAKVDGADAAVAAANQAAADAEAKATAAEAALAAEQADHAELVSTLESLTINVPAA